MKEATRKKEEQLGESFSTASSRLRKQIMFSMAQQLNLDVCFHCGKKIDSVDEFSIEHKKPWLDSSNPVEAFYDLNNIAFSHAACNSGAARYAKVATSKAGYRGVYASHKNSRNKPYKACITCNRKLKFLGYFATPELAAARYDEAAVEYHGNKAVTNKSLGLL